MPEEKKEKLIHFLCGNVPAAQFLIICGTMNWAAENGFKITKMVNTLVLPPAQRVIGQPGQMPVPETKTFIYCSSTEENFKKYFNEEYNLEKVADYPKMIGNIEKEKHPENFENLG